MSANERARQAAAWVRANPPGQVRLDADRDLLADALQAVAATGTAPELLWALVRALAPLGAGMSAACAAAPGTAPHKCCGTWVCPGPDLAERPCTCPCHGRDRA